MGSKRKADGREHFAPLPIRALRDRKLSRVDLAVLGVVAAHDRFTKNGRGCWAGRERIAHLAGCDVASVSRALMKLETCGYIRSEAVGKDRRRRTYFVIYNEHDRNLISTKSNPTPAQDKLRRGQAMGDGSVTHSSESGDLEKPHLVEIKAQFPPNIYPERNKTSGESEKIDARTRLRRGDWPQSERSLASHLSELERRFDRGEWSNAEARARLAPLKRLATSREEEKHFERIGEKIGLSYDELALLD